MGKQHKNILTILWDRIKNFYKKEPQTDDITMLCKECSGGPPENKITVKADCIELGNITAFIDGILESHECPPKVQMQIDLCVEEVFVNIANYAYPDGEGNVDIAINTLEQEVSIIFTDCGIPYDPLQKTDPDVTLSAEERDVGGLGIFLVKKNMDSVAYYRVDGKNVLTLKKSF